MQLLENFKELTVHLKNAEQLKGLILQLAIQGKLTQKWREQNPDIEPASVLFEKVKAEKAKLFKEKKRKKEKQIPFLEEEIIKYTIHKSWISCNLGDIIELLSGRDLTPKEYSNTPLKYPYLTGASQIINGEIILTRWTDNPQVLSIPEDVLISVKGTIGKTAINNIGEIHIARQIMALRTHGWIAPKYLKLFLDSYVSQLQVLSNGIIPGIAREHLLLAEIPLPPLEEQKAIVNIVNLLFAEVDQLEVQTKERIQLKIDFVTSALNQLTGAKEVNGEWAFLQQHFKSFLNTKEAVKKLRETILQLAVQGKLTNHWRSKNPNQEAASVLLEKIKAEKEQLIMEKKIKKEKPLPEIAKDEIPYELPDGWVWCRMGSLTDIQRGSSPRPKGDPRYFSTEKTQNHWISIKDMTKNSENNVLLDTEEFLTDLGTQFSRYVNKNELLVAVSGSTTGKCCLTGIEGYFYDGIAMIRLIGDDINQEYHLIYYLKQYNQMNDAKFGAAFPNINTTILSEMLFPLPPFKEQKAIVEKVNILMSLCDQLEQEIEQNTKQVEDLMGSCLREVFEN